MVFFPLRAARERGIPVGLGTDASLNNTNNLMHEMFFSALMHNSLHHDPGFLTAPDVLRLATHGSAATMGMDRKIGAIVAGRKADFAFLTEKPPV